MFGTAQTEGVTPNPLDINMMIKADTPMTGEFSIVIAELGVAREPDLGALAATYVILLAVAGGLLYHFDSVLTGLFRRRRPNRGQPGRVET